MVEQVILKLIQFCHRFQECVSRCIIFVKQFFFPSTYVTFSSWKRCFSWTPKNWSMFSAGTATFKFPRPSTNSYFRCSRYTVMLHRLLLCLDGLCFRQKEILNQNAKFLFVHCFYKDIIIVTYTTEISKEITEMLWKLDMIFFEGCHFLEIIWIICSCC